MMMMMISLLWLYSIYAAVLLLIVGGGTAFVASPPSTTQAISSTCLHGSNENDGRITRRGLLFRSTAVVGASSLLKPASARAANNGSTAIKKKSPSTVVVSKTLCDPAVSTYIKTYDDNTMRTIHLLGTAHISEESAKLAGKIVRDVKPDVVFVELDAKRVARAIPGAVNGGRKGESSGSGSVASTSFTSTPEPTDISSTPKRANPFDVESRLTVMGSKVVGDSVKGMYQKMESEGFKAGDEFAMSVKEGLAVGSTIVLGDRDVEITLQRLTRALTKTDIRKLLSADSEVEKSMEELLPEGMKNQLAKQSSSNNKSGSGDESGMSGVSVSKEEFSVFVETMKTKDNVKKIMSALRSTAPEIYEAMVAERDRYMGRGLDELATTLNTKVDSTVAVVGMAHVDGIETYLANMGWKELKYPCPAIR